MQVFLPYSNFKKSLSVLDKRRLGKQRVEAWQIINILLFGAKKRGWANHPAVLMWKNNIDSLVEYYNESLDEFARRGGNNIKLRPISAPPGEVPKWLGDERLHASHRANLLRKDPEFYGSNEWSENPTEGYFWPSKTIEYS